MHAEEVQALEMHGTGTALGDPIELGAAASALGGHRTFPLQLSAAKSYLGHTEPAAGAASMCRAVLRCVWLGTSWHCVAMTCEGTRIRWTHSCIAQLRH